MLCLCHYGPALLTFWFQTDLRWGNSACYLKLQAGKTDAFHFSRHYHHYHALVMLYVQFLCSDWSKFDMWVRAEYLYILKLLYFDSLSWQGFVSTCDVFNCLFPLDVQNDIQLQGCALKDFKGAQCSVTCEIQCAQHMISMKKLRFSSRLRTNVRHHRPSGSARAQPWAAIKSLL